MLNVLVLIFIMLSVVMLNVIMLSVIVLNVEALASDVEGMFLSNDN